MDDGRGRQVSRGHHTQVRLDCPLFFYSTLCLYALYSTYTNYFAAHNLTFSCNTYMNIEPQTPRDRHRTGLSRPTDHLQNAALVCFRVYLCIYVCMYVNMHCIYVFMYIQKKCFSKSKLKITHNFCTNFCTVSQYIPVCQIISYFDHFPRRLPRLRLWET